MRGLLDLTDNRIGERVEHPQGVVCYDDLDPYLVVAADKGTAHLPDTANAVSQEYGFWLSDAFASGGSRGYDHKVLGITARGAWECVKRHFRVERLSIVGPRMGRIWTLSIDCCFPMDLSAGFTSLGMR
jgi:glutamate dehydrogenase